MRPVVSSVRVERPRPEVFAHLDVLANHEAFTDHYLQDWSTSGPASGVGARARMRAVLPGARRWLDMEVVSAREPEEIIEESTDDGRSRRNRGTFHLAEDGPGTRVTFTFEQVEAPLVDRLAAPLARGLLQRNNDRALTRLAEHLS